MNEFIVIGYQATLLQHIPTKYNQNRLCSCGDIAQNVITSINYMCQSLEKRVQSLSDHFRDMSGFSEMVNSGCFYILTQGHAVESPLSARDVCS